MTSPLIAQLTALDDAQLQARLRERLRGAPAGFPLGPDEPPEDLLLSAYQEAPGDELRARLRAAFAGNDDETTQRRRWNLQLARAELLRQHTATKHPVRQQQLANAIADVDRRLAELASLRPTAPSLPPKPDRALLSKPERASAGSRTKLGH